MVYELTVNVKLMENILKVNCFETAQGALFVYDLSVNC